MERIVCKFKQYYFYGTQKDCPLYERCSTLPRLPKRPLPASLWGLNSVYRFVYAVPLTDKEKNIMLYIRMKLMPEEEKKES